MIKLLPPTLLFSSLAFLTPGQEIKIGRLEVVIKNIKSDKGMILVGLSHTKEDFASRETADRGKKAPIKDGAARVVFEELPYGEYAAKVMHDENNNDKMDFNFLGLPKEDYGFSNNPSALGMPSFDKAKFSLDGKSKTIIIELN